MLYRKLFDPPAVLNEPFPGTTGEGLGDRREGAVYVFDDDIVLAVNVALAADRPLLISGDPGSGKSSLAASVAAHMGWRYESAVITPRTQASDLEWQFDALRRLRDAQAGDLKPDAEYIRPGVLWRAFDGGDDGRPAVVLLDEIDKADPDVPNSLLEALGSLTFRVTETDEVISASSDAVPFVVLTTNNERDLPRPFLRRCVSLALSAPDESRLKQIAESHDLLDEHGIASETAARVVRLRDEGRAKRQPYPGTAEYLDALRACRELHVRPNTPEWEAIAKVALEKSDGAGLA